MTHTYSRGCFKLIFRKCLPIYTPLPSVPRAHAEIHILVRSLSRLPAFSRFRIVERYYNTSTTTLFLLFAVFPGLGYFLSFLFSSLFFLSIFFDFLLFRPFSCPSLHPFSSFVLAFFFFFFSSRSSFFYSLLPYVSFPFNFTSSSFIFLLMCSFFLFLLLVFLHIDFFFFIPYSFTTFSLTSSL